MFDLSAMEQAIKDAVKALNRPYIAEIKSYGGEFDDDLSEIVTRFPAVWVTFSGSGNPERLGAKRYKLPLTFVTLVGARSVRNEETARHGVKVNGTTVDVGTFQLLGDVAFALLGQDFGLPIEKFKLGKVGTVFNTKTKDEAISVLSQEWHTTVTITTPDHEADEAEWLERVNIDYLLQPQDDVPDAADLVQLTED